MADQPDAVSGPPAPHRDRRAVPTPKRTAHRNMTTHSDVERRHHELHCRRAPTRPGPRVDFLIWTARNPLKNPESDEGIQEKPSPFSWFGLVWLGRALVWLGLVRRDLLSGHSRIRPLGRERSSDASKNAELKALHDARRREVIAPPRLDQPEGGAEHGGEALAVVPRDGKAAASFRPVGREGRDDRVTARPQGQREALHIGGLIGWIGEEVKRGAVVPDVVASVGRPGGRVRDEPVRFSPPPRRAAPSPLRSPLPKCRGR